MVAASRWQQNLHHAAHGSHAQLCDESFDSPPRAAWSVLASAGCACTVNLWAVGGRRRFLVKARRLRHPAYGELFCDPLSSEDMRLFAWCTRNSSQSFTQPRFATAIAEKA